MIIIPSLPRHAAVLALLAILLPAPAAAQDAPDRWFLAVGPSAGGGSRVEGGLGGVIQLVWQEGPRHLALRTAGLVSFAGFPDSSNDDGAAEFGVVYGRTRTTSWGHAAWGAGLAAVSLDGCGEAGRETCSTVGIPLVAEAALESTLAGLGLQAWVNVNPEAPFGGLALLVQLGWMP